MQNFNVEMTCSRNARMTGVMMVSSGMLCSVIHVVSTAFFELRPGALFSAKAAGEQFNGDCDSLSCRNDKIFNTFFVKC